MEGGDVPDDVVSGASNDAASLGLALLRASREKADALLDKQSRYLDLQMEDLHEQRDLTVSHLHWRRISDWFRVSWQLLAVLIVSLIALALVAELALASRASGLVIDAFSVPADLASRGVTGEAAANQVLIRLNQMSAGDYYEQSSGSYRSGTGESLRVSIPQTNVSVGELDRYLRSLLGHEVHVVGQIMHDQGGLVLALRSGANPGTIITEANDDISRLLQKAAERVFEQDRPLRFADYLVTQRRFDEALAILVPASRSGTSRQRAHALTGWALALEGNEDFVAATQKFRDASELDPLDPTASAYLGFADAALSHEEESNESFVRAIKNFQGPEASTLEPALIEVSIPQCEQYVHSSKGEFGAAALDARRVLEIDRDPQDYSLNLVLEVADLLAAHDLEEAQTVSHLLAGVAVNSADALWLEMLRASAREDWKVAAEMGRKANAATTSAAAIAPFLATSVWPEWAVALARSGDRASADSLIAKTPMDCDRCLRDRGSIAWSNGDTVQAAHWYSEVAARSPSIPFANTDWGRMLLRHGELDAAIGKFGRAHRQGPRFADPLELWGEALIAQNRSDLALARFEDASHDAPKWGRLRLKWGEALLWLGRGGEARAQFQLASQLDLNAHDRAELASVTADLRQQLPH